MYSLHLRHVVYLLCGGRSQPAAAQSREHGYCTPIQYHSIPGTSPTSAGRPADFSSFVFRLGMQRSHHATTPNYFTPLPVLSMPYLLSLAADFSRKVQGDVPQHKREGTTGAGGLKTVPRNRHEPEEGMPHHGKGAQFLTRICVVSSSL